MARSDFLKGGIIVGLAVLGFLEAMDLTDSMQIGVGPPEVIGPDRYLKIICAALFGCGFLILISRWKGRRGAEDKPQQPGKSAHVVLAAAVYVIYIFATPVLGYFLSSLFFFPAAFWIFGVRPRLKSVLLGAGVAAISYLLFVFLMGVPLPRGWLQLSL